MADKGDGRQGGAQIATALEGTGCTILAAETISAGRGELVTVSCLTDTLRETTQKVTVSRRAGNGRPYVRDPEDFVKQQKLRRSRLREGRPDRGLEVDRILARRLRTISNRSIARRVLFALSQGEEARMTQWGDIGHTAVRDGVAFATLSLWHNAMWRAGELKLKGRSLPDTALAAIGGREVHAIMEIPLLEGVTVIRGRNGADGMVLRCDAETEPYFEVWRDLGGE